MREVRWRGGGVYFACCVVYRVRCTTRHTTAVRGMRTQGRSTRELVIAIALYGKRRSRIIRRLYINKIADAEKKSESGEEKGVKRLTTSGNNERQ